MKIITLIVLSTIVLFPLSALAEDLYYVSGSGEIYKDEPYKETISKQKVSKGKNDMKKSSKEFLKDLPPIPMLLPDPICTSPRGEQVVIVDWGIHYTKVKGVTGPCKDMTGFIKNSDLYKYK
jgi:hypothetical protein